jgi:hypothetical protein
MKPQTSRMGSWYVLRGHVYRPTQGALGTGLWCIDKQRKIEGTQQNTGFGATSVHHEFGMISPAIKPRLRGEESEPSRLSY